MNSDIKIYFGDRKVILTNKVKKTIEKKKGLFLKTGKEPLPKGFMEHYAENPHLPDLYILCKNPGKMYRNMGKSFLLLEAAGGLVLNNRQDLLCIFRRGVWDLPKGKAEPGEKPEQTALREVSEECGLKEGLEIKKFLGYSHHSYALDGQWIIKRTSWFSMKYEGEENPSPQEEEDISRVSWIPLQEASEELSRGYASIGEITRNFLRKRS